MEVGLFFTFRNPAPWARRPDRLYAETLEQVRFAEEVGFDGVWLGEHHFTDDGFTPSPLTVAAAVAAVTSRVSIGTFVLLLPQHHPVRLAEAAAAVDLLSGGRLVLGLGLGYRTTEFSTMGEEFRQRGQVMDEGLEILVRCFTEESFSFHGRHFKLSEVAVTPRPLQEPMPRIILGGSSQAMLERAARFGCSGLAVSPPPALLERHARLVAEQGGDPGSQRYYGMAIGFPGKTQEAAWQVAEPHARWEFDHYNQWFTGSGQPPQFPNGLAEDFVIGDPAHWLETIERRLGGPPPLRCDHLVVELTTSGMAHADVMAGIELFAQAILPALHAR